MTELEFLEDINALVSQTFEEHGGPGRPSDTGERISELEGGCRPAVWELRFGRLSCILCVYTEPGLRTAARH